MKSRQVLWYQRQNAITLHHWLGIELERMEWVLISGLTNRVGGNASSETDRIYRGCLQDASRVVMRLGRCEKNREGPSELHAKWVGELTRGLLSSVGAHLDVGTRNGTVCMAVWFFSTSLLKRWMLTVILALVRCPLDQSREVSHRTITSWWKKPNCLYQQMVRYTKCGRYIQWSTIQP